MTPIWTDDDVTTVLQAFPLPAPAKESPSLLRSLSGNHLVQSESTLRRLENLLSSSNQLYSIEKLDSELEVRGTDALLPLLPFPIHYSQADNRQSVIIPGPVANNIVEQLWTAAEERMVDLNAFALAEDINPSSLTKLIESSDKEWKRIQAERGTEHLCRYSLYAKVKDDIYNAMRDAGSCVLDLKNCGGGFPQSVLGDIATELIARHESLGGVVDRSGGKAVFVPVAHAVEQQRSLEGAYKAAVDFLRSDLSRSGYVIVRPELYEDQLRSANKSLDTLIEEVQAHRKEDVGADTYNAVDSFDCGGIILLMHKRALDRTLQYVKSFVIETAALSWTSRAAGTPTPSFDNAVDGRLAASPGPAAYKEEWEAVLRTPYRHEMAKDFEAKVSELAELERLAFATFYQNQILGPVELYVRGIHTASDTTLKQHLEEFLGDYFRREALPDAIKNAKAQGLLKDKTRTREVDKMSQAISEAKTLSSIATSVQKCAKKLKVEAPSSEDLSQTKKRALEQRLQGFRKMKRGSDVLQNLVWILLAKETDGTFMSSGKDTTRMIKLYAAVGADAEVVKKLEGWKEVLKSGQDSKEGVEEMRELGVKATEGMLATAV